MDELYRPRTRRLAYSVGSFGAAAAMATLLTANLPSEDEEDEDFVVPEAGTRKEGRIKRCA